MVYSYNKSPLIYSLDFIFTSREGLHFSEYETNSDH